MASCCSGSNKVSSDGFKIVPESKEKITSVWCEQALQKGGTISKETKVTGVEIQAVGNDALGKDLFDRSHNPSHLTMYPDVLKIKTIIVVKQIFAKMPFVYYL